MGFERNDNYSSSGELPSVLLVRDIDQHSSARRAPHCCRPVAPAYGDDGHGDVLNGGGERFPVAARTAGREDVTSRRGNGARLQDISVPRDRKSTRLNSSHVKMSY